MRWAIISGATTTASVKRVRFAAEEQSEDESSEEDTAPLWFGEFVPEDVVESWRDGGSQ